IRRTVEYFDVQGGSSLHHLEAIAAMRSGKPAEVRAAIERDIGRFFDVALAVVDVDASDREVAS
ncbi:hypothetical protein, partial [Klebsiella aerogenes]|uniref:hypothetical protein n=1 Tax=Klebsiella aerogenes TaxID=548 RepID=UPI001952BC5E